MADPLSLSTGILSLITLAIKLVVGAAGMVDKTVTAHREATNELQGLQWDLERLERQMDQIHRTLQVLATNTKDRAFKKLLQNEYGSMAVRDLCSALDETFAVLEQLTGRAEAEKTNLQSITLPSNEKSLAYVQAVLRHNFSPSKVASLVDNLKRMQFEIRACLEKLESVYQHVNDLYTINHNRLERVATSSSTVSTSTILTARIKLADWLKRREGIWKLGNRNTSTKLSDFLDTDYLLQMPSDSLPPPEVYALPPGQSLEDRSRRPSQPTVDEVFPKMQLSVNPEIIRQYYGLPSPTSAPVKKGALEKNPSLTVDEDFQEIQPSVDLGIIRQYYSLPSPASAPVDEIQFVATPPLNVGPPLPRRTNDPNSPPPTTGLPSTSDGRLLLPNQPARGPPPRSPARANSRHKRSGVMLNSRLTSPSLRPPSPSMRVPSPISPPSYPLRPPGTAAGTGGSQRGKALPFPTEPVGGGNYLLNRRADASVFSTPLRTAKGTFTDTRVFDGRLSEDFEDLVVPVCVGLEDPQQANLVPSPRRETHKSKSTRAGGYESDGADTRHSLNTYHVRNTLYARDGEDQFTFLDEKEREEAMRQMPMSAGGIWKAVPDNIEKEREQGRERLLRLLVAQGTNNSI